MVIIIIDKFEMHRAFSADQKRAFWLKTVPRVEQVKTFYVISLDGALYWCSSVKQNAKMDCWWHGVWENSSSTPTSTFRSRIKKSQYKVLERPLNRHESGGDLVLIQTSVFFSCRYWSVSERTTALHMKGREVCIKARSPPASFWLKDQVIEYTTLYYLKKYKNKLKRKHE